MKPLRTTMPPSRIRIKAGVAEADRVNLLNYIFSLKSRKLPPILSLDHLALLIGVEAHIIHAMTNAPDQFYRSFKVSKSSGGQRQISAPLPSLLLVQQWILKCILEAIPIHPAAKAYLKGRSIKENARLHRNQNFVFKADVKDFFGSITEYQVTEIFRNMGFLRSVSVGLSKLCTLDGALPQGAPTSGYLSNILLFSFDQDLLKFAQECNLRYSRYADDIALSGRNPDVSLLREHIKEKLRPLGLKLNGRKTKTLKRSQRQIVTGVVVNEKLSLSKVEMRALRLEFYHIEKQGIFGHAIHIGSKNPRYMIDSLIGRFSHAIFIKSSDLELKNKRKKLIEMRRDAFGR